MARGEKVRFMVEKAVDDLDDIKEFNRLGFVYWDELSDEKTFVFMKRKRLGDTNCNFAIILTKKFKPFIGMMI
ncbi:hypothetical protein [Desulfosporosinus sp.]|uniref:hypothetical protein n=1 Tax=Desulfosporosinus sp. TaxID=157907 RepID=UPI0025C70EF8|nr:hypothetical protein [Desulfosporosinus sp.]MBC2724707.1 hypothetical protein [Desulfosporosinus sp.]MBC2726081.1 hypothetical protein [Desulfosporosinus sp.]